MTHAQAEMYIITSDWESQLHNYYCTCADKNGSFLLHVLLVMAGG